MRPFQLASLRPLAAGVVLAVVVALPFAACSAAPAAAPASSAPPASPASSASSASPAPPASPASTPAAAPAPAPAVDPATGALTLDDGRVIARLLAPAHAAAEHAATCKPWHQLFAPGGRQLTKDLGGRFEHHRGLFVGWNQVRCGERTLDFWHCRHGETQRVVHVEPTGRPASEHAVAIDWCAADGAVVLHERRRLAVRALGPGCTAVLVDLELRAAGAPVQLHGDPHHAGCQLRAAQQFAAAGAAPVTYVLPASARRTGDDVWSDCAWMAARLPFVDGDVVVLRAEHPDNPPATWSARGYGRFGAMCSATVAAAAPLRLRIAYVIVCDRPELVGELDAARAACAQLAAAAFAP